MRSLQFLSLFLLVSICAAGSACDTQTAQPNANAPVNSATPVATQTPTQTPPPTASPTATASASPLAKSTHMTYSVYKDAGGQWRWRLVAANNRIIADSGESYHNKQDCLAAIELIKNSKDAPVSEKP